MTAISVIGKRLYVGGGFDHVGAALRPSGVAAARLRDGSLTAFSPRGVEEAAAIAASGHLILMGASRGGGGAFDARTGAHLTGYRWVSESSAIAVTRSTIYLGGNTYRTPRGYLIALDRSGNQKRWYPNLARYVSVGTIAVSADKAFVGGSFVQASASDGPKRKRAPGTRSPRPI